ncbi:peptide ABC transporter ATP-binding protein (plasmid) [Rhizobium sp. ACO-34A]|nr:ABC transporter ATP-binding protein [Rhizobium sp. ACO-34A]ATN36818.1 peptide ABC transporter ATP-binding protein [Rhizobium sp. ACO-34A]
MMSEFKRVPLLEVSNLTLKHHASTGPTTILRDVSLELGRGEILGVIGESGAGKSTLGNAILGQLAPGLERTAGAIRFEGKALGDKDGRQRDGIRGRRISAIFQDHTASLDPLMTIGAQIEETIRAARGNASRRQAREHALALLSRVGIPDPDARYHSYPHQFSGGQRQRAVIAIALASDPDVIIADEPTSALDATVQKQILGLLRGLVDETHVSIVLVTHDMGVIAEIADRVLVMRNGEVVEQDATAIVLDSPRNDYTRSLLAAVPRLRISPPEMSDATGGDAGASPCGCAPGSHEAAPILVAQGVTKAFAVPGFAHWFSRNNAKPALQDVSVRLGRGAITGIVGESGSGKTTIGRIVAGLETAGEGKIEIDGAVFDISRPRRRSGLLGRVQMIFQDPAVSLNPRMTIRETLEESVRYGAKRESGPVMPDAGAMIDRLGLARALMERYPHQLSGGQKQRVCIARALLARPQIIVADEPTSALDVSVQAEIVSLLKESIAEEGISMLFISHDLALVQDLCRAIYIFKDGRVEDFGSPDFIFLQSRNPYTRSLIDARSLRFTH